MVELKNVSVKMKLVADVHKPADGARVVPSKPEPVKPRVDIKSEVETYDAKPGKADGTRVVGNSGGNGGVKAGGGVLGHLLSTKTVPDPAKLTNAELAKVLAPFVGQDVVVANYDRDFATLGEAVKKNDVADARGKLVGVDESGVKLEKDGKVNTVQTEYWAIARIRVDGGPVIAQDPSYPRHYSE